MTSCNYLQQATLQLLPYHDTEVCSALGQPKLSHPGLNTYWITPHSEQLSHTAPKDNADVNVWVVVLMLKSNRKRFAPNLPKTGDS